MHNKCKHMQQISIIYASQYLISGTGCSPGGLGHALALEFHDQKARVFATARRHEALEDFRALGIDTLVLDVSSDESVRAAAAYVSDATGGTLDILVNNAGQGYAMPATDMDISKVQTLFNTNLFGAMRMVKAFAPLVIAAKGKIVNNGSMAGTFPLPFRSAYAASKAALHSYGDALRLEMQPLDVAVITLVTGAVESAGSAKDAVDAILPGSLYVEPLKALLEISSRMKDRTPAAIWSLEVVTRVLSQSNPRWFWVGSRASVMWFVTTFLPRAVVDFVLSRVFGLSDMKKNTKRRA